MRCCFCHLVLLVACASCHHPADVGRELAGDEAGSSASSTDEPRELAAGDPPDTASDTRRPARNTPDQDAEPAAAVAVNRFALDLYQQLRSRPGNLFYSPSSISAALAMTGAGASGSTKAEIENALRLPIHRLQAEMAAWCRSWEGEQPKGVRLKLANRLWGQADVKFLPAFLQVTRDGYGAELAQLDFARQGEARRTMNAWVADHTEHKITNLLPVGAVSADTKLVLTNAVYFHGSWTRPFEKDRTRDEEFRLSSTNSVRVPTMYCRARFQYGTIDDLQLLQLDYGDQSVSMVVLLPQEVDGLIDVETKLNYPNLRRWMAAVRPTEAVEVHLPRFNVTSEFELGGVLKVLGVKSAFDAGSADFSDMTGDRDLFISSVIHQALVDVNEEGTEAAAATGVVLEPTGAPVQERRPAPVFRADHPFICLIQDNRTGTLLFAGRITNPLSTP